MYSGILLTKIRIASSSAAFIPINCDGLFQQRFQLSEMQPFLRIIRNAGKHEQGPVPQYEAPRIRSAAFFLFAACYRSKNIDRQPYRSA
jgi:hypothetical protein